MLAVFGLCRVDLIAAVAAGYWTIILWKWQVMWLCFQHSSDPLLDNLYCSFRAITPTVHTWTDLRINVDTFWFVLNGCTGCSYCRTAYYLSFENMVMLLCFDLLDLPYWNTLPCLFRANKYTYKVFVGVVIFACYILFMQSGFNSSCSRRILDHNTLKMISYVVMFLTF